jgi:hypothetical protein
MRQVALYDIVDRQIIPLPDEYRFNVHEVYLVPEGIMLRVIPVNSDGTKLLDDIQRAIFAGPKTREDRPPPAAPTSIAYLAPDVARQCTTGRITIADILRLHPWLTAVRISTSVADELRDEARSARPGRLAIVNIVLETFGHKPSSLTSKGVLHRLTPLRSELGLSDGDLHTIADALDESAAVITERVAAFSQIGDLMLLPWTPRSDPDHIPSPEDDAPEPEAPAPRPVSDEPSEPQLRLMDETTRPRAAAA